MSRPAFLAMMAIIVFVGFTPARAVAHAGAIDIAFYGGFTRGAGKCLRRIAAAGQRCTQQLYQLNRRCLDAEIRGETCDRNQLDLEIDAVFGRALGSIASCTGGQLTEILLIGNTDARNDMREFCRRGEQLMVLAYGPFENGQLTSDADRRCVLRAGELSQKLYRRSLDLKTRALDRLVVRLLTPTQKRKLLNDIRQHVGVTRNHVATALAAECPQFEALYGKTPSDFAAAVDATADCAIGFLYVQNAMLCLQ